MKNFKRINNILGWAIGVVASTIYIITSEPTASFWDCGEYISTAYKLQVGHPPGAPLFQMIGRFFSLFATKQSEVAQMINIMSAISSGLTIMFLYWTIVHFARKMFSNPEDKATMIAVFGSGFVGAMAYTFSDSFWFSAVEGEVYGMSSFFTAVVFWAMLKWEENADHPHSIRWLILIAYLMGLSIGVHMLNLLAIPAMTFIFYFKKYKPTTKGIIITFLISVLLLGLVQNIIIPQVVNLYAKFELMTVNGFGLPFNSGTILLTLLLSGGIVYGLIYTHKKKKMVLNAIILSFTFLLIGYSSFVMLVIRSQANTPLDENNPDNAIGLLSYLNREQYGDWPLLYGPYFNAPKDQEKPYLDGSPVYAKDNQKGRYVIVDERKNEIPNYDKKFCTLFPRMWSSQSHHVNSYKNWSNFKGTPVKYVDAEGNVEIINKPTFGENMSYFFNYQVGWMYLRYFMWNFAGKQNDIQGAGNILEGNWISGISFIDNARLGNQDLLPDVAKNNKGSNKFYFLPLLLGLLGMYFHYKNNKHDFGVVVLLFILTGLAIIIYLNQYPLQPRERDYAYAGSFYAFAVWIGIGVLGIFKFLSKYTPSKIGAISAVLISALCVPTIMAAEGWDDHDRSNRFTALAVAHNYLNSCEKNAILFTNGDNDTFPLWYAQEVEGIRTDVRVCNLNLLNMDWYIDQMKQKVYDSDPLPIGITKDKYIAGKRAVVYLIQDNERCKQDQYYNLKELLSFAYSDDTKDKYLNGDHYLDYIPTKNLSIPVDKNYILQQKIVPQKDADKVVNAVNWTINSWAVQKNNLILLDILANNNWKRPVYFAITSGKSSFIGLEQYFQLEGLTYRLVPKMDTTSKVQIGSVHTDLMYNNLMNKFIWGNINKSGVYLDETNIRMTMNFRNNFFRLADACMKENKRDSALKVLDRCMEIMPNELVPYDNFMLPIANLYFMLNKGEKANSICEILLETYGDYLNYFSTLSLSKKKYVLSDQYRDYKVVKNIAMMAAIHKQRNLLTKANTILEKYRKLMPDDLESSSIKNTDVPF